MKLFQLKTADCDVLLIDLNTITAIKLHKDQPDAHVRADGKSYVVDAQSLFLALDAAEIDTRFYSTEPAKTEE